jgi:apolipoprotein N-acyltransferase
MATNTMTTQSRREHTLHISEPSVRQIIANARAKPVRPGSRGAWILGGMSALVQWASFTPLDWGPLGWVALVPLVLLVRIPRRTSLMYAATYVTGLATTLAWLHWMPLGDKTMYIAWLALAIYMAVYFPLFVALARTAVHRFGVPLALAVPVVWVGLEFARAHVMTGFAWYYLAHSQYRWIELIQISDITGAYGVSFLLAMTSAVIAEFIPASFFSKCKLVLPAASPGGSQGVAEASFKHKVIAVATSVALVSATLAYGYVRRAQADFHEGPRVALVQGNFTSAVKHDRDQSEQILYVHRELTGATVSHQPDLIVWPESMFPYFLYEASPDVTSEQLRAIAPPMPEQAVDEWVAAWRSPTARMMLIDRSREAHAPMIVGVNAVEAEAERFRQYNSAVYVDPDLGLKGRYDKLHRVPFGEFIPLKDSLPFLHRLTPFSDQFGVAAGKRPVRFDDSKRGFSYAPLICFEDTVPHVVREIVNSTSQNADKPVDCLVNLTNDGWFHGSSELDQHLITASFRAVECRTPLVRAVNTGISAYIDGDGVILEPEVMIDADKKDRDRMRDPETGRWYKQRNAAMVHPIPLDNRGSLYVKWGDWFAGLCGLCVVILIACSLLPRRKHAAAVPVA